MMFFYALCLPAFLLLGAGLAQAGDSHSVNQQEKPELCPASPNCVSSRNLDGKHRIAPFTLQGDSVHAWDAVRAEASALPRTRVIAESATELLLECRSRLFHFVDEVHLVLDLEAKVVHVRSASRTGYWDFGVNRKRIEALRSRLREKGVVR